MNKKHLEKLYNEINTLLMESSLEEYEKSLDLVYENTITNMFNYFNDLTGYDSSILKDKKQEAFKVISKTGSKNFNTWVARMTSFANRDLKPTETLELNKHAMKLYEDMDKWLTMKAKSLPDAPHHNGKITAFKINLNDYSKDAILKKKEQIKDIVEKTSKKYHKNLSDVKNRYINIIILGVLILLITLVLYIGKETYEIKTGIKKSINESINNIKKPKQSVLTIETIISVIMRPFKAIIDFFKKLGPGFSLGILLGIGLITYGLVMLYRKTMSSMGMEDDFKKEIENLKLGGLSS